MTRRAQAAVFSAVLTALAVGPSLLSSPPSADAATRETAPADLSSAAVDGWYDLEVPGGVAALALAAGLPERTEPWRLISQIARRVHAPYGEGRVETSAVDRIAAHLDSLAGSGAPVPGRGAAAARPAETVPLPLSPDLWRRAVRVSSPGDLGLLRTLVTEPAAAMLYSGLLRLDGSALAAISDERTIARLAARHADVFALLAPAFRVRASRVAPPGGEAEEAAWQAVVGAPLGDPPRFLLALLGRDGGRLALLYAALADLDPERQAWALALDEGADARVERLRRWRRLASRQRDWWRGDPGPFLRPDNDLAAGIAAVTLGPGGRPAPSDRRGFWEAVFTGPGSAPERVAVADAPWLVKQLTGVDVFEGRQRFLALRFAQRVFGDAPEAALPDVVRALRGLRSFPALAPVLERLGVRDPALHAAVVSRASGLSRGPESRLGERVAPFQGALALLDGARRSGVLTAEDSVDAVRGLLSASDPEDAEAVGLARWLDSALLPLLAGRSGCSEETPAEEVVVRALAGKRAGEPLPQILWEGLDYAVDVAGADAARIAAVRRAQESVGLRDALDRCSHPAPVRGEGCRRSLAEALTALAYAAHLSAPPADVREHTARRHRFDVDAGASTRASAALAWSLPEAVPSPGSGWHVAGSLLGLDMALARQRLVRADAVPPARAPTLDPGDRQSFAEAAALAGSAELDDVSRDALAAALRRGRARVAHAFDDAPARDAMAAELVVHPRPLLEWTARHGPRAWTSLFSLADLLRLGAADLPSLAAWGLPARWGSARLLPRLPPAPFDERALAGRPYQGALGEQVTDLHLRIAEALSLRRLPARLAGPVLLRATQDLLDRARPAYAEDGRSVALEARELPAERIDEYVATLVGSVLVPVAE